MPHAQEGLLSCHYFKVQNKKEGPAIIPDIPVRRATAGGSLQSVQASATTLSCSLLVGKGRVPPRWMYVVCACTV